mmetsp:Transcript_139150/g.266832  ORF Transcript_139150/g.266832 Transcript_139150/m.266832 type:complete len:209 (-) Transcript_139150:237-863(-)
MISLSHPICGATWQSKNPITSPVAALPPVSLAFIRPCVVSCLKTLTLQCGFSSNFLGSFSNSVRRGGSEPSSTTMISARFASGVRSQKRCTVMSAFSRSSAQGRTTEMVFAWLPCKTPPKGLGDGAAAAFPIWFPLAVSWSLPCTSLCSQLSGCPLGILPMSGRTTPCPLSFSAYTTCAAIMAFCTQRLPACRMLSAWWWSWIALPRR